MASDNSHTLQASSLELLGLTERDYTLYLALLQLGSAPVRTLAQEAGMSRATVHDALKRLLALGLVSYVDAKAHRYFRAEDPVALRGLATRAEVAAQETRQKIARMVPELQGLAGSSAYRPSVRYYEGATGVKTLLQDVLTHTQEQEEPLYRVYSSAGIRDLIYQAWPTMSRVRKRQQVHCRSIALGEGGQTVGLDERKWLTREERAPTYIFIYGRKTAYVAQVADGELFGVIIEDGGIATTQRMIFDMLWRHL